MYVSCTLSREALLFRCFYKHTNQVRPFMNPSLQVKQSGVFYAINAKMAALFKNQPKVRFSLYTLYGSVPAQLDTLPLRHNECKSVNIVVTTFGYFRTKRYQSQQYQTRAMLQKNDTNSSGAIRGGNFILHIHFSTCNWRMRFSTCIWHMCFGHVHEQIT